MTADRIAPSLNPWTARLRTPGEEREFRRTRLPQERMQTVLLYILVAFVSSLFLVADYRFMGGGGRFMGMVAFRSVFSLLTLACIPVVFRCVGTTGLYRLNMVWAFLFTGYVLFAASTRPPAYGIHLLGDVIVLFALYVVLPATPAHQFGPAMLLSAGLAYTLFAVKTLQPGSETMLAVAIVFTNVLGVWISRRTNLDKRIQYLLYARERILRTRLEHQLKTVRTLEGLLPMCSACKKIRDDKGYWQQVEEYVEQHSRAAFSHGICPECTEKLYPELAGELKKRKEAYPD